MEAHEKRLEEPAAMVLNPVGVVQSPLKNPMLRVGKQGLEHEREHGDHDATHPDFRTVRSEIEVFPAFEELLDGVEGFSHLLVLFWAHRIPPEGRCLRKVRPCGLKENPHRGIFATCSPARPNPVLINAVELVEKKGNLLTVIGLEAVEATPVLDIKPYLPMYFRVEEPVRLPDWMKRMLKRFEGG